MSAAMTLASCGGTKDAGQQQKIHVAVVQQLRTRQQCPAQQRNNAEQQHHPPLLPLALGKGKGRLCAHHAIHQQHQAKQQRQQPFKGHGALYGTQ